MLQSLLPGPVEAVLASLAGWLLTCGVLSTLLLGIAWLVDGRAPGARSPAGRVRLWTVAAVVPVLAATARVGLDVGPRVRIDTAEAEKLVATFGSALGPEVREATPTPESDGAAASWDDGAAGSASLRDPYAEGRSDPGAWWASRGHDWPFLLALAWLVAAGLLLGRRARGWIRLRRRLGDRRPIRSGALRDALDGVLAEAGVQRRIRLTASEALVSPVALPGAEICVPERTVHRLGPRRQRALLAHEAAHVLRRDTPRLVLLTLLRDALFFQPLLRLARRRAADAAEELADDRVRELGLGAPLARSLIEVARWVRADAAGIGLARMEGATGVERRVRRLFEEPAAAGRERDRNSVLPGLAATVLLVLGLPAAEIATSAHPAGHAEGGAAPAGADRAPRWIRSLAVRAPDDLHPRLSRLAAGDGDALYVRITGSGDGLVLTLRGGAEDVRLVGPEGRSSRAPLASDGEEGARAAFVGLEAPRGGRLELRVPGRVDRVAIEVDGRLLVDPGALSGDELPRIVSLR